MPDNAAMTFFARNVGIHFVSFSLTCAVTPIDGVSSVFYHPMLAMIGSSNFRRSPPTTSTRCSSRTPRARDYKMTYVPNIVVGLGIAPSSASAP